MHERGGVPQLDIYQSAYNHPKPISSVKIMIYRYHVVKKKSFWDLQQNNTIAWALKAEGWEDASPAV